MRGHYLLAAAAFVIMGGAFVGCNCGNIEPIDDDGGVPNADGGTDGDGGESPDGGELPDGGAQPDAGELPDGGVAVDGGICYPATCQGKTYLCGNCLDDDLDGLADGFDPDCLGPCHNREDSFDLGIPGGGHGNCGSIECYYDSNSGRGNDDCFYDLTCDPLEPDPACMYSGSGVGTNPACPATQSQVCYDVCRAVTPNGCDCFGCCSVTLDDGGYRDIFLGSEQSSGQACTVETAGDPAKCFSCTKNPSCEKGCSVCQLCLGKTELPPECFPDGGTLTLPDGGMLPDGGTLQCPGGEQPCGLPGQAACPAGYYCLTGCCIGSIM